jgi:hypothetical protein
VIEIRKQERREARKRAEEERQVRIRKLGQKKRVVLLRWGRPKKPKD